MGRIKDIIDSVIREAVDVNATGSGRNRGSRAKPWPGTTIADPDDRPELTNVDQTELQKRFMESAEPDVDPSTLPDNPEDHGYNEEGFKLDDRYEFQGFKIAIEQAVGSKREWTDGQGNSGSTTMSNAYGYIEKTVGVDDDPIDVYIGPSEDAKFVYVIHQMTKPDFVESDEDKCMIGFESEEDAREAYLKHYDDEGFYGGMSSMPVEKFKEKVSGSNAAKITNEMPIPVEPLHDAEPEGPLLLTREADLFGGDSSSTQTPDSSRADLNSAGGDDAIEAAIKANATPFKKHGIDVSNLTRLGSGEMGVAYDIGGNKVLKITTDASEAKASHAIKGKKLSRVVQVDDVWKLRGTEPTLFALVTEKLNELSQEEKNEVKTAFAFIREHEPVLASIATQSWDEFVDKLYAEMEKDTAEESGIDQKSPGGKNRIRKITVRKHSFIVNKLKELKIDEMVADLRRVGIQFADYHEDNIMKRGNEFVINDLGSSKTGGGGVVPVLESCISAFTSDIIESMQGVKLKEGGNAVESDRVPLENIDPTIDVFSKFALSKMKYKSVKPIGSTGKKSSSGDIDLGFDTEMTLEEIGSQLKALGLNFKIFKGLGEVSVEFPQYSPEGKTDLKAQIDLMIGPEEWTQFQYYGPGEESNYKGVYVRGLVNGLLRVLGNFSVSPARGIFSKDDKAKKYFQDPNKIAQIISSKSSEHWSIQDLKQPFEIMWKKTKKTIKPEDVAKIKEYFLGFMKSTKMPPPSEINEAPEKKKARPKGIVHLEDMKPEHFMEWLKKYADTPLEGGLEISEKVDGSAFMIFGVENGKLFVQSKNGPKMFKASSWSKKPMTDALRTAHGALESKMDAITSSWPEGVSAFTSEILYMKVPNSVEYGPNVIMIHGVMSDSGQALSPSEAEKFSKQIIIPTSGQLAFEGEQWKFEYKPVIKPEDLMVDVKVEYDSLGEIYKDLQAAEPDKRKKAGKEIYKAHLEKFKTIQAAVKKKLITQVRGMKSVYGPEGGDIEGIVFRDLDDDSLVKLVDKEYFTKLNSFMWHYRKLLDQGVKIGDEWKTGVTQNMKNLIAHDVLGDQKASSTSFVKSLVKKSADIKFPKGVKKPMQKVDYVLAKYIKDNNLMQGDFITKFKDSVATAKKEFEDIKSEWDAEKSGDMMFTVKDDSGNKIKDIKMDPLIAKRTDRAMAGMDKFFDVTDEAISEVSSMSNDITKKVALLKIMMGHRAERLAGELNNMKKIKTEAGDLFGGGNSSKGKTPSSTTDVNEPKNAAGILKKFKGKLSKRPSLAGTNLDSPRELGAGTQGTAYDIGGKVLKITKDNKEAVASHKIMGDSMKYVAKVEDVFRFPDSNLYGVVQEKLAPMDSADAKNFNKLLVFTGLPVWLKNASTWDDAVDKAMNYVEKRKAKGNITSPEGKRMIQWADQFLDSLEKKYNVRASWEELKGKGITFSDYQADNLMKRGSEYVLIDIGLSDVSGGAEPPTLENLKRMIQTEIRSVFSLDEANEIISEDSRGKIRNILKFPKFLADKLHELDAKHAFALASAFLKWHLQSTSIEKSDPFMLKKHPEYDTPTSDQTWGHLYDAWFDQTKAQSVQAYGYGDLILKALELNPNLSKKIKSLPFDDVKKLVKDTLRNNVQKADMKKNAVIKFPDGHYWYDIDKHECDDEAKAMGHCGIDYRGKLFSLRDKNNKSHVTVTLDKASSTIYQIKGKENTLPNSRYWPHVKKFVEFFKATIEDEELKKSKPGSKGSNFITAVTGVKDVPSDVIKVIGGREWRKEGPDSAAVTGNIFIWKLYKGGKLLEGTDGVEMSVSHDLKDLYNLMNGEEDELEISQFKFVMAFFRSSGVREPTFHITDWETPLSYSSSKTNLIIQNSFEEAGVHPKLIESKIKSIDSLILSEASKLFTEGAADTIGVTIGRFQPFHKGHAEIIRNLASKFTKVVVIIAGNKPGEKNPFSYETRLDLMKKSLKDVMPKIETYKSEWDGKPSGFLPGVLNDIIGDHNSSIEPKTAVNILVGPDRFDSMNRMMQSAGKHSDKLQHLDPSLFTVSKLPGVKTNIDDDDRISATSVRDALAANDKQAVEKMLDPHVTSNPAGFDSIYNDLRKELGRTTKVQELTEQFLQEFGGMGGSSGMGNSPGSSAGTGSSQSSHWSSAKFNTRRQVTLPGDEELEEAGGPRHSMDFNKWNPWPIDDGVMPFDKSAAQSKQISDAQGSGEEIDKKSVQQTGHGELKFAKIIDGSISDSAEYDVDDGDGKSKWEVKQINSTKKSTAFRITIRPGPSWEFKKRMTDIVNQLVSAFAPYKNNPDIIDKELKLKMGGEAALGIIAAAEQHVIKGATGIQFLKGKYSKKKGVTPGLITLLGQLSGAIKREEQNTQGKGKKDVQVLVGDHEIKDLSTKQYIAITKILGVDPKTITVGLASKISAGLTDPAFENPKEINGMWDKVNADIPEIFTHSADYLVIVDEVKGFFPIAKKDISKYVRFNGASGKELSFEFRKEFLK